MSCAKYQTVLNTLEVKTYLQKAKEINAIHKTALARNLENLDINMIFFLNQCLVFENHYCCCLYSVGRRKGRRNNLLWHLSLFTHKKVGGPFSQSPHTAAACPRLTAPSITPPRTLGVLGFSFLNQDREMLSQNAGPSRTGPFCPKTSHKWCSISLWL